MMSDSKNGNQVENQSESVIESFKIKIENLINENSKLKLENKILKEENSTLKNKLHINGLIDLDLNKDEEPSNATINDMDKSFGLLNGKNIKYFLISLIQYNIDNYMV